MLPLALRSCHSGSASIHSGALRALGMHSWKSGLPYADTWEHSAFPVYLSSLDRQSQLAVCSRGVALQAYCGELIRIAGSGR